MIVATLFGLVLRSPAIAHEMLAFRGKSAWTEASFMTGLYFLALTAIFIMYYSLHRVANEA